MYIKIGVLSVVLMYYILLEKEQLNPEIHIHLLDLTMQEQMRKCNFIDPWHPRFKIFKDIPVCSE